jgi:rhodanese-related sulfurtransferase
MNRQSNSRPREVRGAQPPLVPDHMMMRTIQQVRKKCETYLCPKNIRAAVLVLAVFLAWLPAQVGQPSSQGKVFHIDARSLDLLLQSDPNLLLIDVRTPGELTGPLGKIPQARNIPLQELEKNPEQFDHNKTLVLICRSGHRSLKAADLLAEHGYVVYSVDGGMREWHKLHPQASSSEGGAQQKEPSARDHAPDTEEPTPPGNGDQHHPERFFDNNMGC